MVKLSSETKRAVFRLLCSASYLRDEIQYAAARGWADAVAFYRKELRCRLAEARDLVENDLFAQLKAGKEARNAPTQVSATAAFQRLRVLCVLRRNSLLSSRSVAQGRNLSQLHAPWAAPKCGRSVALPTPNAVRQARAAPAP